MKTQSLAIDLIRTDGGTQMRAELQSEVYLDYRDKWLAGVEFEPLDVFHDGSTFWLADGFHRFYGAREAKRGSIPCRVHQGTQRDAILFAAAANTSHGLRRMDADKRNAILTLLRDVEWGKWSDAKIAEHVSVTRRYVGQVRESFANPPKKEGTDSPPHANGKPKTVKRVGRDGKVYEVPKKEKPAEQAKAEPDKANGDSEPPAGKLFSKLLEHLRQSVLLLDEINKAAPNPKARQEIFDSLECANQDILKWRKAAK